MNKKDILLMILDIGVWYAFTYFWLHTLREEEVVLWQNTLILIILAIVGVLECPWVYNSDFWKNIKK